MKCADCSVAIHQPKDARPDSEVWVCPRDFGDRWRAAGKPSDANTGQIVMNDAAGKRVRWSSVEG